MDELPEEAIQKNNDLVAVMERHLVMLRELGCMDLLTGGGDLREGTHVNGPKVKVVRARSVTATPMGPEPVLIDVDGEGPGRLPARFEILPGALTLRC